MGNGRQAARRLKLLEHRTKLYPAANTNKVRRLRKLLEDLHTRGLVWRCTGCGKYHLPKQFTCDFCHAAKP